MLNGIFYSLKAAHNPRLLKWKSGLREIKTKYIYYSGMKLNYPTRLTSPRNKKMAGEENRINETEPNFQDPRWRQFKYFTFLVMNVNKHFRADRFQGFSMNR